jgi:hypothetical protein
MNDDLSAARAKLAGARDLWRMLGDRLRHMDAIARSKRLEHDEMIQLAYQYRSVQVAQGRAMDDARSWRRVIARLEGRDPELQGPLSRARKRMATPGYLYRSSGSISRSSGPVRLSHHGAIHLDRSAGYCTRMLGSS